MTELKRKRITYQTMVDYTRDPNAGAKSVLTALAGPTAALTATMVAEPAGTGPTSLRGYSSRVLVDASPGADALATGMALAPAIAPSAGAAISSATKSQARGSRTVDTLRTTKNRFRS